MKKKEILQKAIDWATGDDTGVSSMAICRYMLGLNPNGWGNMAPSDIYDRSRCIRLLNKIPEWWGSLEEMKGISKEWKEQIELMEAERG